MAELAKRKTNMAEHAKLCEDNEMEELAKLQRQ